MHTQTKLVLIALLLSSTAANAQAATTQAPPTNKGTSYRDTAHVTEIRILTQHFNQPQQVCNQVPGAPTQSKATPKHPYGGAVIGGVAGGLLGHTVGEGSGKDAATAGGAVIGALVGEHMQSQAAAASAQAKPPTTVTQCYFVDNWVERQSGAIVTYTWHGRTITETLPYVPTFHAGDDVQLNVTTSLAGHA
ncbi:hypothetical protein GCM10025771_42370 [Niveibacterium umoris]|uniref:Uncharacterized protein YcfJ n=1 Tax=Niveibacterium umoris TaxID=1193620 RepID=A0A840BQ11_9RHOO|nr:glycine zipper 2TM domain-containing protein [Niveibacterium umoris]MBB4014764.1 uncharacterized protein YcfJ [Niveibacterium umoris]